MTLFVVLLAGCSDETGNVDAVDAASNDGAATVDGSGEADVTGDGSAPDGSGDAPLDAGDGSAPDGAQDAAPDGSGDAGPSDAADGGSEAGQAPTVTLEIVEPQGVGCGDTITSAQDVDTLTSGVQIKVRVVAPGATSRKLEVTTDAGTTELDASSDGGDVIVTLAGGANGLVGVGSNAFGTTETASCSLTLPDIAVAFTGAPATGAVGKKDGTVSGSSLAFTLSGTVSASGAAVSVSVDDASPVAAQTNGTTWTAPLTLAEKGTPYQITATAAQTGHVGTATLALTVDLTGPSQPVNVASSIPNRHAIQLKLDAPSDGGNAAASYLLRYATTALDDANFDATGTSATAPTPAAPGTPQTAIVSPLRTGTPYWLGIAAVDALGNRSAPQVVGPIVPAFDSAAAIDPPNTVGNAGFGNTMVRGHFNDDEFEDVAVGAPFVTSNGIAAAGEVYIFLGSASGFASTPATTIRGTAPGGQLGNGLARVRWSSATRDDLALSAPFAGAIYVMNGGAALPIGSVDVTTAQRKIVPNATASWFSGSGLGWVLATADHDGDGTDDLVATAVFGGGGNAGAAVIFYGGTIPTGTVSISTLTAAGSGSAVMRMYEIVDPNFPGLYLFNLGRTQGAGDVGDDIAVGESPDAVGQAVWVYRGDGRPPAPGVTQEPFTVGRDVKLQYDPTVSGTDFGAMITTIEDQNADGARDIVVAAPRSGSDKGRVVIYDGDTVGVAGVATKDTPGVVLTDMSVTTSMAFGSLILGNADSKAADVDGDGREDLVIGRRGATAELAIWFGPVPVGTQVDPTPDLVLAGPAGLTGALPSNGGTSLRGAWVDVNGDGLDDMCWADWSGNGLDGRVHFFWDDGN